MKEKDQASHLEQQRKKNYILLGLIVVFIVTLFVVTIIKASFIGK